MNTERLAQIPNYGQNTIILRTLTEKARAIRIAFHKDRACWVIEAENEPGVWKEVSVVSAYPPVVAAFGGAPTKKG